MPKTLCLLALLLCVPASLCGADVLPSSGKSVGFIRDETPGFWLVLAQDFSPVEAKFFEGDDKAGYRGCVFEGAPGSRYMAIKIEQGRPKTFPVILTGSGPGPVPTPIPPGPAPTPPPDPTPPPPPAPKGAARVILLYEETKLPHPWSAEDQAVEAWLHTNVPGSWHRWDDDYVADSFKRYPAAVSDLYLFGKGSRPDNEPTVVVEFKDGQRKSYIMPEQPAALLKLLEGFK